LLLTSMVCKEQKIEQRSGAFAIGMLQTVVNEGKNARAMLRNHEYDTEEERQQLLHTIKQAKPFEAILEAAKKRNGF
jgi:hypothetical protein